MLWGTDRIVTLSQQNPIIVHMLFYTIYLFFTENDEEWMELRHLHIAKVSTLVVYGVGVS